MPERPDPVGELLRVARERGIDTTYRSPPKPPRSPKQPPSQWSPRSWSAQHQIALAIAAALGASAMLLVGFELSHAYSFLDWARPRVPYRLAFSTEWQGYWDWGGGIPWGFFGALMGAALVYVVKLLR